MHLRLALPSSAHEATSPQQVGTQMWQSSLAELQLSTMHSGLRHTTATPLAAQHVAATHSVCNREALDARSYARSCDTDVDIRGQSLVVDFLIRTVRDTCNNTRYWTY